MSPATPRRVNPPLTGFDNQTKEFTSVWVDSMGTGTGVSKGKRGEDGSPTMEMFVSHTKHGEEEMKMMELVYERPEAAPADGE